MGKVEYYTTGGHSRLDLYLPGIFWLNFFSKKYVNFIGEDKFNSIEQKERLNNGSYMIYLNHNPKEWNTNKSREIELSIKNIIGDIFFDKNNPKEKKTSPFNK